MIQRSKSGLSYTSEISHVPSASLTYVGSPALLKCSNGVLLASHDLFGAGAPTNGTANRFNAGYIFRSTDQGATWSRQSVTGMFWGTLFELSGSVYQLALSCQFGALRIRKSTDFGSTWGSWSTLLTTPGEGSSLTPPNWHMAPQPPLITGGRIYFGVENRNYSSTVSWDSNYYDTEAGVFHASTSADLTDAASWTRSNGIPFSAAWQPTWSSTRTAWIEGQCLQAPDGSIKMLIRCMGNSAKDKIALLSFDLATNTLSFNSSTGFLTLPGGFCKFTVIDDRSVSGKYVVFHNWLRDLANGTYDEVTPRNVIGYSTSTDLLTWTAGEELITFSEPKGWQTSIDATGYQYPFPILDGAYLLMAVRTAVGAAPNNHDANKLTFHRRPIPWR